MAKHNRFVVVALVLCALGVVTLHGDTRAQSASPAAVIDGSIVDAVGAVIPGATITLEQPPKVLATTISNVSGQFRFEKVGLGTYTLRVALPGFKTAMRNVTIARRDERVSVGSIVLEVGGLTETVTVEGLSMVQTSSGERAMAVRQHGRMSGKFNTESYAHIVSNPFKLTTAEPLSTFAADVDTASYSNVRRFLRDGELPPPDAVRIEELINYFRFSYAEPGGRDPVSITGEVGDCPWAPTHKLALIGVRARPIDDRAPKRRSIVLLIDVSGSMKERTEAHLRIGHALAHAVERIEVFTFGTRLTRVTRAMRLKNREQALAATSAIVSDWDGGTRIGDALQAFLGVPRFAGYSRGALVLILSDGLERGDPAAMRDAVARLSRLAWRVSWLTPLAAGANFTPQTEGLKAILPLVDDLADGSSVGAVTAHVLNLEGRRAA